MPRNIRMLCAALALLLVTLPGAALAADAEAPITKAGVRFYPKGKRIEMDGRFAMSEGPIELLICAKGGKAYESVIEVNANPEILHFCLLLLKLKPGAAGPRFQGDPEHGPTGSPVIIRVRWKDKAGETKTVRAEQLCWNTIDKRPMVETPWVFVGSKKQRDPETKRTVYQANIDKTIAAVYRDPFAVLDLPLALGANDDAYIVNKQVAPGRDVPCTVILTPGTQPEPRLNEAGGRIFLLDVTAGGRTLIDGAAPQDLGKALKQRAASAPKGTCEVTVDHGPAGHAAAALEAVAAAGIAVEAVRTVRVQPGVPDGLTVEVSADGFAVGGKKLSAKDLSTVVRALAKEGETAGVLVIVRPKTPLGTVVAAFRACGGVDGVLLRVTWGIEAPASGQK